MLATSFSTPSSIWGRMVESIVRLANGNMGGKGQLTLGSRGGMDPGQKTLCVRDVRSELVDDFVQLLANGSILFDLDFELFKQLGINHGCRHFVCCCLVAGGGL